MTWGALYHPKQSSWDESPATVHDERALGFITDFNPYDGFGTPTPRPTAVHSHSARPMPSDLLNDPAFSPDPMANPHHDHTEPPPRVISRSPPALDTHISRSHTTLTQHAHRNLSRSPPNPSHYFDSTSMPASTPSSEAGSSVAFSPFEAPTVSSCSSEDPSDTQFSASSPSHSKHNNQYFKPKNNPVHISPPHHAEQPLQSDEHDQTYVAVTSRSPPPFLSSDGNTRGGNRQRAPARQVTSTPPNPLDRIDEMDETAQHGGGYHHSPPYEAIGSDLAHLGPPHMYNDVDVLRGNYSRSPGGDEAGPIPHALGKEKQRQRPRPSPAQNDGLSLHLEPGQILRRMPTYDPKTSVPLVGRGDIITPAGTNTKHPRIEPAILPPSDHSRSKSTSHTIISAPPRGASLARRDLHGRNATNASEPPSHYHRQDAPRDPPLPARSSRSSESYAPPNANLPPQVNSVNPPYMHASRSNVNVSNLTGGDDRGQGWEGYPISHRSSRSLDSSAMSFTSATSGSIYSAQRGGPPPNHIPKRLVMPIPLQSQHMPSRTPPSRPGGYGSSEYSGPSPLPSEEKERAAMYSDRKLLRKRTPAFPSNVPLPKHAPANQDDSPLISKKPSKKASDIEKANSVRDKEPLHRRKLSKRRN
ncbi:hypothetical protein CONPUDRAFT_134235 [Coniophora puteana RWD-64-598 SS2]|uniref:Pal1-domain-containing protein n=1 Tax=Coniophora puteana (strain RWD-64-598) TaxID=741705 RepID=A0A5M3N652_CONPW|nr:uncharacterized protein CONPUDRAFT_134235 [Coniophora puteana RWD-64-598 SS2]EIW86893.1 hypothetical protein CONPUDRAFT_134235 [Coniophora puteana RWD-64-598 SS2]